jgi:hypothetical protein
LRGAEALFAAADLGWFARGTDTWSADPWSAFDDLIRVTLSTRERGSLTTEPALPATTPIALRPARAMSRPTSPPIAGRAHPVQDAWLPAPARLPAVGPALRSTSPSRATAPARLEPTVSRPPIGRIARLAARPPSKYIEPKSIAPVARQATSAPVTRGPVDISAPALLSEADVALMPDADMTVASKPEPPAISARGLGVFLDVSREPASAEALSAQSRTQLRAVDRGTHAEPAAVRTWPPPADVARPTRLVNSLPALQHLFHAAVADSRDRHAVAAADQAQAPPAPAHVESAFAPPLRAFPVLDEVTEDILVDRLTDRLRERLREQVLRQFGFTSGLI